MQIILFFITSCNYKKSYDSDYYCKKLRLNCTKKNERVTFFTSKGDFEVELFGKNYPVTAANFVNNVNKNIYRKKGFYKIINYPQVRIIQSGIFSGNNYNINENQIYKNKNLSIPLEIKFKKEVESRYGEQITEPSEISNLINVFEKGSLAMVKSGEKNSSSTEFFFVTDKFPELNGRYSIFGKIVRGIEVLDNIKKNDLIFEIVVLN